MVTLTAAEGDGVEGEETLTLNAMMGNVVVGSVIITTPRCPFPERPGGKGFQFGRGFALGSDPGGRPGEPPTRRGAGNGEWEGQHAG